MAPLTDSLPSPGQQFKTTKHLGIAQRGEIWKLGTHRGRMQCCTGNQTDFLPSF